MSFMKGIKATKNMLQLDTANFNLFKIAAQYQFFSFFMIQLLSAQIQRAPSPDFRTVGKSMVMNSLVVKIVGIVIIRIINTSYDISIHMMGDQLEKKGDKQTLF